MTHTLSEPRPDTPPTAARRGTFWNRQLDHYPDNGRRAAYLGITVLATVVLYYELYVQGAVATQIISHFGFTFTEFVAILAIGNLVGAFASLAAGLADRWGRANLVVIGLFVTGLIILLGLPRAGDKTTYGILFALLSLVEGVVLVATPALIRDFSPQVGRGAAMGFWTLGPVLGSLVVTEVSSNTLKSHPDFQFQFYLCGAVGVVVAVIAFAGLRELSPPIRDQLMVSLEDRVLIEARARDVDPDAELHGAWRQMLRVDIIGPAFAVGVFLLLYYMLVAFAVIYFVTVYGYSEARANSLLNWYWITNAIALVVAGVVSDKVRVRKPFMLVGAAISMVGAALFATAATDSSVGYYTLAVYFVLGAGGGGLAYVAWMAAFTETVERHNPAATATGLAVWGWILRATVTIGFATLIIALPATGVLVDKGQRAQALLAKYPTEIATLAKIDPITSGLLSNPKDAAAQAQAVAEIAGGSVSFGDVAVLNDIQTKYPNQLATLMAVDPATSQTLVATPTDQAAIGKAVSDIAAKFGVSQSAATARLVAAAQAIPTPNQKILLYKGPAIAAAVAALKHAASTIPVADQQFLTKNSSAVQRAQRDNAHQWQRWWWICFGGQVVFVPLIFLLSGRWNPAKAKQDEQEHEQLVAAELARMHVGDAPPQQASYRSPTDETVELRRPPEGSLDPN